MARIVGITEVRFVALADVLPTDEIVIDLAEMDRFAQYLLDAHAKTLERGDLVRAAEIERTQRTPERTILIRRKVS